MVGESWVMGRWRYNHHSSTVWCCLTRLTKWGNERAKNGNRKRYISCSFPDTLHQANGKAIKERDIHHENQKKEELQRCNLHQHILSLYVIFCSLNKKKPSFYDRRGDKIMGTATEKFPYRLVPNLILNVAHGVQELTLGHIEMFRFATWWDVFFNALAAN